MVHLFEFGPNQMRVVGAQLEAGYPACCFKRGAKLRRHTPGCNPLLNSLIAASAGNFGGLSLASSSVNSFIYERVLFHEYDSMLEKLALQEILALMQGFLVVKVLP